MLLSLTACVKIPLSADTVFQPKPSVSPSHFEHATATLEDFFFASTDGTAINAWYLKQPGAEQTILFFGGYGFYLVQSSEYLEVFLRHGVNALLWDYRGYGRSEGKPSVAAVKADALRAYDALRERYAVPAATIVLHGHSLGTFLATYVAGQREVAGVILESPVTAAEDWVQTTVPWYLRMFLRFQIADELAGEDNRTRVAELTAPLLLLAGDEDKVAPPHMAETLYELASSADKTLEVIAAGEHNGLMAKPAYQAAYARFLGENNYH